MAVTALTMEPAENNMYYQITGVLKLLEACHKVDHIIKTPNTVLT